MTLAKFMLNGLADNIIQHVISPYIYSRVYVVKCKIFKMWSCSLYFWL